MYLKRLEMRGFKSFADKTNIDFDNGVTCIVGPNGSGKSNITDAVRWVLGEQKVKTLRGSKMEDVIFNGTKHRKKLGMAEVTLVFDNSERFFSLDYNEVKVCRRVYRSGESEYLINDTNCRLKDVRDLFMDTGIGTDGYSIIGQGRIESVLSSNLDERRQLFEEAAGIVKYKTRKRETERKLDNTEQNLIRIEDIYRELASRVEPLRIESEKAKQHLELTERLSELELNVLINEIESVDHKIAKEDEKIKETQLDLDENQASVKRLIAQKDESSAAIETLQEELKAMENDFYENRNIMANLDGDMNVIKARIESNELEEKRVLESLNDHEQNIKALKEEQQILQNRKSDVEEEINLYQSTVDSHQQIFESQSKALFDAQQKTDQLRQSIISRLNEIERYKSEIASYHTILDNHNARKNELSKEIEETEVLNHQSRQKEKDFEDQLERLNESEASLKSKENQLTSALNELEKKISDENVVLNDLKKKLTEYTTEANLLKQMEKEHAGYDHSVKKALSIIDHEKKLSEGHEGVVASLMEIPKKYEVAIEVAMGKAIQNLVVQTPEDAKAIISELKRTNSGRVTFIPLSSIEAKGDQSDNLAALKKLKGYIGKTNELFDFDAKYATLFDYLVGRTVIVDNVDTATEALKINQLKYKVITLEGDIFIPGGTITGGSYKSKSSGLLSRKRKIVELDEQVLATGDEIDSRSKDLHELRDNQKNIKFDLEQTSKICEDLRIEIVKKQNDLTGAQEEVKRLSQIISKRKSEQIIIDNDIQSVHDAITEREDSIKVIGQLNKDMETSILNEEKHLGEVTSEIQSIREQLTEIKVKHATTLETFKHLEGEIRRLSQNQNQMLQGLEQAEQLLTEGKAQKSILLDNLYQLEAQKNELLAQSENKHQIIDQMQSKIKGHHKIIHDINNDNKERFEYIESLKETLHRYDIKRAKYDVHRDDIATRLFERYEMSPEEAILMKKDIDMINANKEISQIRKDLKVIGDVNIHAIEEYEEVSERYLFLKEQHDDLVNAKNTLKKLIKELEKEMKEKFLDTFEVVKVHFAEIFESLFVGGVAELQIADMENVLESDIMINVQPPGKKLQNIGLLSGGEKSLTAIALLFAILKTKPAPFCILDEIEAALDDVNVYRFADFLKAFTRNSQFVIITHRKGTMEIADNLFGVTMQEFGVSKMISVKLEDAVLE
ncbi:MAG: chromosome segregation protein SMC [Clostridia bacterium]|nr:chromosome segregation protein SMC [Clostridia bacterium]